jgi:predicted HicB family RNase H-like nuclease
MNFSDNRITLMARKKSIEARGDELLQQAKEWAKDSRDWIELHNRIFGVGGLAGQLFPTQPERTEFAKTKAFQEIQSLMDDEYDEEPDPKHRVAEAMPRASGKFNLRIPRSLHAALILEAEDEGVSLNQLVLAKLACQLRNVVAS